MPVMRSFYDLASLIRSERKRRGWTQADLASHSGIAEKHISRIENETNEPRIATVLSLLHALGLTVHALAEGEAPTGPGTSIEDFF